MTSAVQPAAGHDVTDLRHVLRHAARLGVIQAVLVLAFSLASRVLTGPVELVLQSALVLVGVAATTLLPGIWTRARTIEGIAGAAGIGLGATVVFLLLDVALLQPIGTYTHRWHAIGGGSTWWYHPVWWMVGTYLPWMGAWALARQALRRASPSPAGVLVVALTMTAVLGVAAVFVGFPGAAFGLGTFAVAFVPAIALTVLVAGLGGDNG
jgi:hypothetical protein